MIEIADRANFTEDHHAFRDTVRRVLADVIEPRMAWWSSVKMARSAISIIRESDKIGNL